MCLICVEFQRDRMTISEARRALGEMVESLPSEHVDEVKRLLRAAEREASRPDVHSDDDPS